MDCRAVDRHFGGFLHLCQENVLSEDGKIGYETKTDPLSDAVPLYLRTGGVIGTCMPAERNRKKCRRDKMSLPVL